MVTVTTSVGKFLGDTLAECLQQERKTRRQLEREEKKLKPKRDEAYRRAYAAGFSFMRAIANNEAFPAYDLSRFTGNEHAPALLIFRDDVTHDIEVTTADGNGRMNQLTTTPDAYLFNSAGFVVAVIWERGTEREAVHAVGVCDGVLAFAHLPRVVSTSFNTLDI